MYRFEGLNIKLTRGDSLQFRVVIGGRNLPDGTQALFSVKNSPLDDETVIEKMIPIDADGVVLIGLAGNDSELPPRVYYWDLRVLIPNGDGTYEVRTPMEYSSFTILEAIGNTPDGAAWIPISPIINLNETEDGVEMAVTDADGIKIAHIKNGKDGYTPIKGVDYFDGKDGKDGYTPIKGVDYFDGKDGKDGYTPVKGVDYFDGKDGVDGYTPVKGVDYFDGKDGVDGYTPVKGKDYYTEADKAEMVSAVLSALPVYSGEVADV